MRIVDLSTPVDAAGWEPHPVEHRVISHAEGARHMSEEMREKFGLDFDPAHLPGGEFLSIDILELSTHSGTHVDAPAHYGSVGSYGTPRTIDQMPLDWFYRPGVLLDLTGVAGSTADAAHLEGEFSRIGRTPAPLDIVLLRTGASRWAGDRRYFTDFVGLDASATALLLDLGVRVIGTDAFSLDAPFTDIIERFHTTGDHGVLWPAHFAGRDREYCQIERLANLSALPGSVGFTVCCPPVKIAGAGAGWCRALALVPEDHEGHEGSSAHGEGAGHAESVR
ncbi:cyclase family protein [Streptomyces iconiensis]|uniref:Cyclase family protein n=1 Tax=Streptomyces iconiensis TaxID=1384038 RepID=A0ABT7A6F0_9ACTN|nr:cyclase family protein [Streptomyces iconiensis]MDJ1136889.1 cyclase family protein [Streptomyces iconiensis]